MTTRVQCPATAVLLQLLWRRAYVAVISGANITDVHEQLFKAARLAAANRCTTSSTLSTAGRQR